VIVGGILSGLVGLLTDFVQAVLDGFAGLVNAVIDGWPIGMPDLPDLPSLVLVIFGWARWGPIGVVWDGSFALFTFLIGVYVLYAIAQPLLRMFKVTQ
jgi:uncharacterized membrane protein YuzA (DUF378 family)